MQPLSAGVALALLAAVPASAQVDLVKTSEAKMMSVEGDTLGTLVLNSTPTGVIVEGDLRGLPPGRHAIHVHTIGVCEPPFESAGEHYNPTGAEHGFQSARGPHAGDLPNIGVAADGTAEIEVFTTWLTLDARLFDEDGAAIVIHAEPDDHATQPSGGAGDRIACGVIEPA